MSGLFNSAMVIARRDFIATVWSRSYIIFLLAPLMVLGFSLLVGVTAGRADREASRPAVAVAADQATVDALTQARARLVAGTSDMAFPLLRPVPAEADVEGQARRLIADQEKRLSAVLSGSLDRPIVTGPPELDLGVGGRIQLLIDEARRGAALERAGIQVDSAAPARIVTETAAGNLRSMRSGLAQGAQMLIFMITLMLATLLLSNMVEEKSNKVIEVLAAAVPLDAVFLGKLLAMLGASLVGLVVWALMLGLGYAFVQTLQQWMTIPQVSPAVGWPVFLGLLLFYYAANYMLLGALFLGIGGQASNIREIQSLSMPVTFLQLMVLVLAMNAVSGEGSWVSWAAFIVPFSSPLSMVALAAQSETLWPHLAAFAWQALWVVIIIKLSSSLFRRTVLKSGAPSSLWKTIRGAKA
ncbi:ABC transporter permease [Allosphingosinicella sp.]|jgi:ABC-2 type transport system permease protein|uniref:ABC transporter permease n=1 Tax=Allosphingosinicella sp. TaxID=2823234 RepID=UPI002EFDF11F